MIKTLYTSNKSCPALYKVVSLWVAVAGLTLSHVLPATAQSDSSSEKYTILYDHRTDTDRVAALGYLSGDQLLSTPTAFISNGLTGRIAGLYSTVSSGVPGSDGASLHLRGRTPMILIDGIPRQFADLSLNPEQIESVTVLKDALSSVLYGLRSMDGIVMINTKKGLREKGFQVQVKAQSGLAMSVDVPVPLAAADYARLYNEALTNDGLNPVYSSADIDAFEKGNSPYTHPDINWYNKLLKKQSPFSRYNLSAQGATQSMHYFVTLDYFNQNGALRDFDVNTYSTNSTYKRYIFRSNVSVDLTKRLTMNLDIYGRIRDQNAPGAGVGALYNDLLVTPNNAYPRLNPDSSLGGNINFSNNLYGQLVHSGYTDRIYSDGYADLHLKRNMGDILKGWWVKADLSYTLTLEQLIDRSKQFETFQMHINPETGDTSYQRYGTQSDQKNSSSVTSREHSIYAAFSTGYSHHWNDQDLDILLMYRINSLTNNSTLPNRYQALAGRVQYSLKNRYILQAAASYSGNNRHRPEGRFGLFPAVGAAWNIHQEPFFNPEGFINTLKVRATYGTNAHSATGEYGNGYYQYIDRYGSAAGYHFGSSAASFGGLAPAMMRNVHHWEQAQKFDAGLDIGFARNRGSLSVDYYRNRLTGLAYARGAQSALSGWGVTVYENLGKQLYSGLELSVGWQSGASAHGLSDEVFHYDVQGNISFSDSKVLYSNEPDYPYSWMQHTGLPVGQSFGYVADGFITQAGGGPVVEGYSAVPGDIKYKDLNGDGTINEYDRKALGTQKPLVFYGLDMGLHWKGFSLQLLFQGVANRDRFSTGDGSWAFQHNGTGQAYAFHQNRWTPQTAATATYPRLSVSDNINNYVTSTFWLYSGSYLRLKNAQLRYRFPAIDLGKIRLQQLALFVNGFNLFTISDFPHGDPEVPMGNYPLQRMINAGISIKF